MQFKIDNSAAIKYTRTLEKMNRSALPIAIRDTLNNAAFDLKMNTMPTASNKFLHRQKNFFKANSKVVKAQGFQISSMQSETGFFENNLKGVNYSVKDLEQQEDGGTIAGKSFIPLNTARQGGTKSGLVRANARITRIKNIKNARNSRGKNQKEKFIRAAHAAGKGGYVIAGKNKILFKISGMSFSSKGRTKFKVTPLYEFTKRGKVKVKATHFMFVASMQTAKKMDDFYIKNAERQINKIR